jgi:choline dehydrogenase-like flavoprotein
MIIEGKDIGRDLVETADVVVIGSGCGGATAAKLLAEAGKRVIIVEQGGYFTAARGDFDQRSDNMLARIDGARGLDTTRSGEIALMYGNCVGGASVHYWADSWRLPKDRNEIYLQHGLEGHAPEVLAPIFDQIERELNVHLTEPEHFNRMNTLFNLGAQRLGWATETVPQARKGCVGSGHCYQGCAYDAKQSQLVTYIPAAIAAGAKLYADCRVETILRDDRGRASGVACAIIDRATGQANGRRIEVKARTVVLAAGGFASAGVWLRSKLPNGSGQVGRNLFLNPCPYLYGLYDEPVVMWQNVPTATGVTGFRLARYEQDRYVEGGYLLHPNQLQAEFVAATLPGFGVEHRRLMDQLPNFGSAVSWIDDELPGRISLDNHGRMVYDYTVRGVDMLKTRDALKKQALILFASGAREVIAPDLAGTRLNTPKDIGRFDSIDLSNGAMLFGGPHPAGALRMGKDPATSVVAPDHQAHEVPGLYVADPSVFPRPPSVDPSMTIMAFSVIAARSIVKQT